MRADTDSLILAGLAVLVVASQAAAGGGPRTQITVWAATPAPSALYGGLAYGGSPPTTGAMITEQRVVDVTSGETRIAGVAATLDPASVQLRDVTDPAAQVTEQRFLPGAATPTEILARHVGDPVTVVTPRGEVSGALRAVDDQAIVVEVGAGDQRHLQVMRRDGYVLDLRLPAGGADKPTLAWRLRTAKPGKHTVEIAYRADGMSWTADYLAVLDEPGKTLDFAAWATIKNATGASYDGAELTLVSGAATAARAGGAGRPTPARFTVAGPVRIGQGEAVQVELIPPRTRAPARSVILFEAMPDPSQSFQAFPGADCNQVNGNGAGGGRAEVAVEIDVPGQTVLPEARARLFQRRAGRLEVLTEDPLRASAGVARVRVSPDTDIAGERRAVTCNYDEHARTVHETIEIKIDNKTKQAADVIIREFLWRWPVWHLEAEDHKGVRAGPQIQEYRVRVPASGRQAVTYTAVYAW
ncbi:MAG TPA: hypothetical protein VGD80_13840 [Kofleriaceae bacterium]